MSAHSWTKPLSIAVKNSGFTLTELAYRTGISAERIKEILNGKREPTLREAFRFAWAVGYTIEELFGGLDDTKTDFDPDTTYLQGVIGISTESGGRH